MAFLIASPWNSFSLTLILFALIGIFWTLTFIGLSMLIAIIVGLLYESLQARAILPANPNQTNLPNQFQFWQATKQGIGTVNFNFTFFTSLVTTGLKESRMVLRWILFGVLLASIIRALLPAEHFTTFFGPSLLGLVFTILIATVMEVCSEGSTPIAADLLTRAQAPGNSFAFLMTGVATDYTEIMVLKDATQSWKIPLLLPLLVMPQVFVLAWLLNILGV